MGDVRHAAARKTPRNKPPNDDNVLQIGEVIAGKYRVDRLLGEGGMGIVVAVTHLQLNEQYAMKRLHAHGAADPETVARFLREARASVRIKSEHIARVADVGQLPDGAPYIVMEHLTGQNLADVLDERGPLPTRDAVEVVLQACAGVAEAHAIGVVHRDLKPANLFLTHRSDGAALVKVLDFGIAKAMDQIGGIDDNPHLTATSSAFGTPAYMSPEQLRSAKKVDFRTDVWSLGVILHELLTGVLPFDGESTSAILAAIAADEPQSVRVHRPDIEVAIEAAVLRCLQKDVTKRFQSVAELADALVPFARGSLVSLGRIKRLSSAMPVVPTPLSTPRVRATPALPQHRGGGVVAAARTITEAWSKSSSQVRWLAAIAAFGLTAFVTSVVVYYLRLPATEEPSSTSMSGAPSVATPAATFPAAPPIPSAVVNDEPSSHPSSTAAAAAVAPPPAKPPRGLARPPTTQAHSSPMSNTQRPPLPHAAPSIDPTAESH